MDLTAWCSAERRNLVGEDDPETSQGGSEIESAIIDVRMIGAGSSCAISKPVMVDLCSEVHVIGNRMVTQ